MPFYASVSSLVHQQYGLPVNPEECAYGHWTVLRALRERWGGVSGPLAELKLYGKACCDPSLLFLHKGRGHGRPGGKHHCPVLPEIFEQLHFPASGRRSWTGCFHFCPRFSADAVPAEYPGECRVSGWGLWTKTPVLWWGVFKFCVVQVSAVCRYRVL